MTDEMYARIREVADEHGGKLDVSISHPDLPAPVIAHPQEGARLWRDHRGSVPRPPEVYMTEADLDEFRERIRAEGLRPREPKMMWAQPRSTARVSDFMDFRGPFPDVVEAAAEPSTTDYSRYLDCVYQGTHISHFAAPCPLCGCNAREFEAKAVWD